MRSSTFAQLPRFLRTVRHLRPSQAAWRLRYLVQRRLEAHPWFRLHERQASRIDAAAASVPRPHFLPSAALAPQKHDPLPELQAGKLTLLNRQLPFAGGDDWQMRGGRTEHRLWRYHLHYHGWLADLARGFRLTNDGVYLDELRRWLVDWIDVCRRGEPGFTHYPWNSYAIAQRLCHWREIDALVPKSFWSDAELPRERFCQSLAAQADYLSRHVEWDLRGNHLLKDAVGLAVAAEMLEGSAADRWRAQAEDIVLSQVKEQVLPDGMHFERSPMYHIHALEDLLALATLLDDGRSRTRESSDRSLTTSATTSTDASTLSETLQAACRRMAEPVRWLRHPCGRFPLFNDAAEEQVCRPDEMLALLAERNLCTASSAPRGLRHFADAGLIAWHGEPWTVFFDVGPIGPEYQPGHAHADSLTLEASFDGVPLIVDPGTYCYDDDSSRRSDRSTKAHNTICIDDGDSSEVWHIFRVGRRADPCGVSVEARAQGFAASASHNGYEHLVGSPRHRRQVSAANDGPLEIRDEITGEGRQRAEGGFLLAPEWQAEVTPKGWLLRHGERRIEVDFEPSQAVEFSVVPRPWHPEFGKEIPTKRLAWSGNITLPFRLKTTWQRK